MRAWLVDEGQPIECTELVVEVSTHTLLEQTADEPVVMQVESHDDGILAKVLVPAGSSAVPPGTPIAVMCDEPEQMAQAAAFGEEHAGSVIPLKEERTFLWQAYLKA